MVVVKVVLVVLVVIVVVIVVVVVVVIVVVVVAVLVLVLVLVLLVLVVVVVAARRKTDELLPLAGIRTFVAPGGCAACPSDDRRRGQRCAADVDDSGGVVEYPVVMVYGGLSRTRACLRVHVLA